MHTVCVCARVCVCVCVCVYVCVCVCCLVKRTSYSTLPVLVKGEVNYISLEEL